MGVIKLDLLQFRDQLIIREDEGDRLVLDPVRRKFVPLTKEELVRQLFIQFLIHSEGIARGRIAVERKLSHYKLEKRFDLLVFDRNSRPQMIVECKSNTHKISQEVLNQAGLYNAVIEAPFLLVTNGLETHAFSVDFSKGTFAPLETFPII